MKRRRLTGRTAVITGAASGIGRALALAFAARGMHLALADRDLTGLEQTRERIGDRGLRVTIHPLDVADVDAVAAFPALVLREHPGVDVLVNNAGVALGGTFMQIDPADFAWLFDINFWGVVRMTRAFLGLLLESDDACLVMMSSIFGIIAPAGQSAYVASKFAVRGFSESLRRELRGTPVGVTVVHPGGVATSIAKNARAPKDASAADLERAQKQWGKLLRLSPDAAAEQIVRAIEARRSRVLVGTDAKLAALIERLFPTSYRIG